MISPDHKKDHAHDKVEISGRDYSGFCHEHGKTGDAAECKIVCEFEK